MDKTSTTVMVRGPKRPVPKVIDCKSEEGLTIGLIDSILSVSAILRSRLETLVITHIVKEALSDLNCDTDLQKVVSIAKDNLLDGY